MKILRIKLISVFISLTLITINTACSESEADQNEGTSAEQKAVSVEVEILKDSNYTEYIQVMGTIKPFLKANLSVLEGGNVAKIAKDKGSFVAKGDTLVFIDNDRLQADLDAASARFELAKITYEKQNEIFKQNINSEIQLLQSKSERDQAKAYYDLIKARYDDTFIIAPFSGIVDNKYFEEGEFAAPGLPILSLIDISKVKVEAGVPERYVTDVKKNQRVKINISEISLDPLSGNITYLGSSVVTNNRTFPVEITIRNVDSIIKPEMNAVVSIEKETYENIITIPDDVVSRTDIGYTVYVVENEIAKRKSIEIINRFGNKIAVKSGLKKDQKLITVGFQNLVDGQRVKIVN